VHTGDVSHAAIRPGFGSVPRDSSASWTLRPPHWRGVHKDAVAFAIIHDSPSKAVSEKVKLRVRIPPFATAILAVDDFGLVRMHFTMALRQSRLKRRRDGLRFLLSPAVNQSIIRIPALGRLGNVRPVQTSNV
jgi:hypothetical protein